MKIIIIILLTACTLNSNLRAQNVAKDQVPSAILNSFQTKFPDVKTVEWEQKGDLYKAEFKVESRGHDVWLDKGGVIKKHKEDFPKSSLPEVIRKKIEADFSGYKIDDVDKIEENGAIYYQVDIDGSPGDKKLLFTSTGQLKENNPD